MIARKGEGGDEGVDGIGRKGSKLGLERVPGRSSDY